MFYFCCWFFLPHFFVTLLHKDKKCCLGGNNNTPLPTTTRSSTWATNSRRTRRECRCATPSSPLSVFFFVSERARALLFFLIATTRCTPLAERSRYITIRKRLTQKRFLSPRLKSRAVIKGVGLSANGRSRAEV